MRLPNHFRNTGVLSSYAKPSRKREFSEADTAKHRGEVSGVPRKGYKGSPPFAHPSPSPSVISREDNTTRESPDHCLAVARGHLIPAVYNVATVYPPSMPPKKPSHGASTEPSTHRTPIDENKGKKHGTDGGSSGAKRSRTATENSIIPFDELMRETKGPKHGAYLAYYKDRFYKAKQRIPTKVVTGRDPEQRTKAEEWKYAFVLFIRDAIDTLTGIADQMEKTGASPEDVEAFNAELREELISNRSLTLQVQDPDRMRIQDAVDLLEYVKRTYDETFRESPETSKSRPRAHMASLFLRLYEKLQQLLVEHKEDSVYRSRVTVLKQFHENLVLESEARKDRGNSQDGPRLLRKEVVATFDELRRETDGPKPGKYLAYYREIFNKAKERIPSNAVTGNAGGQRKKAEDWKYAFVGFIREAIYTLTDTVYQPKETGASKEDVEAFKAELRAELATNWALIPQAQDPERASVRDAVDMLQYVKHRFDVDATFGKKSGKSKQVSSHDPRYNAKRTFLRLYPKLEPVLKGNSDAAYAQPVKELSWSYARLTAEKPSAIEETGATSAASARLAGGSARLPPSVPANEGEEEVASAMEDIDIDWTHFLEAGDDAPLDWEWLLRNEQPSGSGS